MRGMKLYDTATGETPEITLSNGEPFRFYCCGPTVYGPAHIGNFRTFVVQDVLRRALEIGGTETYHVRNLTDVDDKTIKGALSAEIPLEEFTQQWTEKFHEDCIALNCLPPHVEPSAVAHIPQQIEMIQTLIDNENAYAGGDGSVYFKISSFPDYGSLSKLDTRELDLGRTQNQRTSQADEYEKDAVSDFVLWKGYKETDGPYSWESPWGKGRPGWHLECSAMIKEYLGKSFHLHGGGVDLVFPHHENEIAQSKCACGGEFAQHWFHVTHLLVEGGKMSKSLGNFYTLSDLAEKGFSATEVRYVLLGAHYRRPLNFTLDSLHAAKEALGKLSKALWDFQEQFGEQEELSYETLCQTREFGLFSDAWGVLNQDLNTQACIGKIFAQLKRLPKQEQSEAAENWRALQAVLAALGITVPEYEPPAAAEVPAEIQEIAEKRAVARAEKDWATCDALRDELAEKGWKIIDGQDGYEIQSL